MAVKSPPPPAGNPPAVSAAAVKSTRVEPPESAVSNPILASRRPETLTDWGLARRLLIEMRMQQSHDEPDDRMADPPAEHRPTPSPNTSPLIIASQDLFRGRAEIWIEHGELMYRLRRTSAGKLYLCK